MPDMAALNIIDLNIDSIQGEIMKCKTNRGQETHAAVEGCTNRDTGGIIKHEGNGQKGQNHSNKSINYLYSSQNTDADRRKSSTMTQKIHDTFSDVLMVLGASKAHSHYSLSWTASHTKCHQGAWYMCYRNHSRRSSSNYKEWTS